MSVPAQYSRPLSWADHELNVSMLLVHTCTGMRSMPTGRTPHVGCQKRRFVPPIQKVDGRLSGRLIARRISSSPHTRSRIQFAVHRCSPSAAARRGRWPCSSCSRPRPSRRVPTAPASMGARTCAPTTQMRGQSSCGALRQPLSNAPRHTVREGDWTRPARVRLVSCVLTELRRAP